MRIRKSKECQNDGRKRVKCSMLGEGRLGITTREGMVARTRDYVVGNEPNFLMLTRVVSMYGT